MSKANYEFFGNMDYLIKWAYSVKPNDLNRGVVNNLRNFKKMPTEESLKDIVSWLRDKGEDVKVKEEDFQISIRISDLTRAVNSAKDNIITSNGKKVFNLLLPTNKEECKIANDYFLCRQDGSYEDEETLFKYLKEESNNYLKDNIKSQIKTYYYLPGRAVTFQQLDRFGEKYSYIPKGIRKGINNLEKNGIVEVIEIVSDDSNVTKICRLSFKGCGNLL